MTLLIDFNQMHYRSQRCRLADGKCRFLYAQEISDDITIPRYNDHFVRDTQETDIIRHNPLLLAYFRCHHFLDIIHSESCIGYVLDYCTKNSDSGRISLRNVLYEGHAVASSEKLQASAATRISSASECFANIFGYWRHHMKTTVEVLRIHLPGQRGRLDIWSW
jgi:hypothetical protein